MPTITQRLREEHQVILKGLALLENLALHLDEGHEISFSEARTLIFALQLVVEKVHHAKEERLLFPALAAHPRLQEGGPRCGHFMGLRIEDDIASHILGSEVASNGLSNANQPYDPTCALSMPMEEHLAGHVGLLRIQLALDALDRMGGRPNRLVTAIREYLRLMRRHIEKEDTCLFVLAENLLTPTELQTLFEKSCEIDRSAGPDMIREMWSMLENQWKKSVRTSA